MKKQKNNFKFKTEHFWKLVEDQEYKCVLTGRELTPLNTEVEHKVPLRLGGKHSLENLYLVDSQLGKFARYLSEKKILDLALEIIKYRGMDLGYELRKKK